MLSSIGFFAALVAFGAVTFALLFVGVGFLLIAPRFGFARVFAGAERSMATWAGVQIEPRPLRPGGTLGWRSVTDPERWRERLVVSHGAVEKHISNLFTKLGLDVEDGNHRRVLAVLTYLRA